MGALIALAPVVVSLIAKVVDKIHGPGKGKEKKLPALLDILAPFLKQLADNGVGLPQKGQELIDYIEPIISTLNKRGELQGFETVIPSDGVDTELLGVAVLLLKKAGVKGI
tara:strand:- start:211 stop:543 length:333 start_codon:yes stop_codon:yes gene_type:complete